MSTPTAPISSRFGKVRNMTQIIYTGLLASLVVLGGVAYALSGRLPVSELLPPAVLLAGGAVLTLFALAMALVLPKTMVERIPREQVALRVNGFAYSRILIAALLSASGLFWAILSLLLDQPACLIGPALAVLLMVAWFPTQSRMEKEIDMNEEAVDRALGYAD